MLRRILMGLVLAVWANCWMVATVSGQELASDSSRATARSNTKKAGKAIVPVFSFFHTLQEAPTDEGPFNTNTESLQDLVHRIDQARDDDDVEAVIVLLGSMPMGSAQLEEIYEALADVKSAGKPVYAFADSLAFRDLALASSASRISVAPVGELMITGLYGSQLHLRGMLDKVHVTPDFTTCGDYKSAGETFMRKEPSSEARRMYDWLFDSLFDTYVGMIADGRDQSRETVRGWIDEGLFSSTKAAELGIIDAVEYRQDLIEHVKKEHGDKVELKTDYGKQKKGSVDLSTPLGAFKLWAELLQGSQSKPSKKDAVAIVYVEGAIVPGRPDPSPFGGSSGMAYSDPIRKALDKAAEDDSVKAVVLRVNSPGGSAVASEIILEATRRVAAEKPFVVSMGDVAGSGGYYVACGADTIFADASTITASIGVVAGKLVTHEMWDSIGVNWHPLKRGKNADMFAPAAVFTSQQKETLQSWMDEVYEVFKQHVVDARGDRLAKPIDELAGGRVFTGKQALELGLVDRLGSLRDSVRFVADKAGLEEGDYQVRVIPKPKNLVEQMMADLVGATDEDEDTIRLGAFNRMQPIWQLFSDVVDRMAPQRAAALRRTLVQLEVLQTEGVTLTTPEFVFE